MQPIVVLPRQGAAARIGLASAIRTPPLFSPVKRDHGCAEMAGRGKKNVDDALLLALASGASIAKAAEKAGCSESTVRRRLADADFRAKVNDARNEMVRGAIGRLASLGIEAADELQRLIEDGKDDNVKLGAARAVLQHMLAGHEHETLAQRMRELLDQMEQVRSTNRQRLEQRQQCSAAPAPQRASQHFDARGNRIDPDADRGEPEKLTRWLAESRAAFGGKPQYGQNN